MGGFNRDRLLMLDKKQFDTDFKKNSPNQENTLVVETVGPQYHNGLNVSVFQMLTNALQRRTIALLMLTVSIHMAHTTAPVKQDILVMESTVQVRLSTIFNIYWTW